MGPSSYSAPMAYIGLEDTKATSSANSAQTVSAGGGAAGANDGVARVINRIMVKYSAAPTQTGVTITINSQDGSAYDTLVLQGTANIQQTYYVDGVTILLPGDTVDVTAPAGGGGITSSVTIVCTGWYGASQ